MNLTFHIPDELAAHMGGTADLAQLERRALEAFALEEFRSQRINKVQLRKMLGLERIELDGFFKAHGMFDDYTMEDFEQERAALKSIGL